MDTRDVYDTMRPYMPNWPSTFEQAERDLVAGVILRVMSKRPAALASWLESKAPMASEVNARRLVQSDEVHAWHSFISPNKPRTTPVGIDRKRRAAGERDDD